jgi:signal transduction histidine kinase
MASVSHELNSPLSSIKLFAQTLRQAELGPEERASFARKIIVDVDRLTHLIANILRAAEVDSRGHELPVVTTELDLLAYLEEYVENARGVYGDRVELVLVGEAAWVEIDPIMFLQVLDNLVDNAIRYRGERPARVEFRIERPGSWVELDVSDRGIGIPKGQLEHVFERFYRIEKRRPQTGARGIGIGLHVVRSIVVSHGGTVSARSPGVGKGTVIRIRLPVFVPAEAEA